jgi:protein-disulfide isomerase
MMQNYSTKQLLLGGFLAPIIAGALIAGLVMVVRSIGITTEERHILGNKNAKVALVEYSDFQCPFCERALPAIKQILADYGDKVSLEYKHFPLSFHPFAQKAAEASECAAEQGKFWEFHDYAFAHQDTLSLEALKQWGRELKLNTSAYDSCLDSGKYAAKVTTDYQAGVALGVQGTPATFVNGVLVSGAQPYSVFKQAVDQALAQ